MNESRTCRSFDLLAPLYESHWGRTFLDHSIRLFRRKLAPRPRPRPGDPVLEFCCGTGHFSKWLDQQRYQVTRIDASDGMLNYARRRLRRSQLLQADVREFQLRRPAHAVVCFCNSLNQFLESDSLTDEEIGRRPPNRQAECGGVRHVVACITFFGKEFICKRIWI